MQRLFDEDNAFGRASAGVGDSGLFGTPQKQNGYGAAFNGNGGITMSPLAPKKDQSGLPPPMANPGGFNTDSHSMSRLPNPTLLPPMGEPGGGGFLTSPQPPPPPDMYPNAVKGSGVTRFVDRPQDLGEATDTLPPNTGGFDVVSYHGGLGGPQPMDDQGYTPNPMPVPPRGWRQPQEGSGNFNPMPVPPRGWRQPMLGNRGPVQMAPRRQDPRNGMFNPPQRMFGPQQGPNTGGMQLPPQVLQYLLSLRGR